MDLNYLLENENFELAEEITPDLEAALVASYTKFSLEEKFAKLNDLKPNCSEEFKKGIEHYIEAKKFMLEKAKSMLNEGYVLFPNQYNGNNFIYPQVLTSIQDFLDIGVNPDCILIKIGEEGYNTCGYGSLTKNMNGELLSVSINKKLLPENMSLKSNPLILKEIKISHKFKRFDIITVPFTYGYAVVLDESDVVGELPDWVYQGNLKTDLYICRLGTVWDYGKPYYFEHVTSIFSVDYCFFKKVEFEDAPAAIRELVFQLKNEYFAKKGIY